LLALCETSRQARQLIPIIGFSFVLLEAAIARKWLHAPSTSNIVPFDLGYPIAAFNVGLFIAVCVGEALGVFFFSSIGDQSGAASGVTDAACH